MHFEPTSLHEVADPFPLYALQRADAPVARSDSGFWCVTGYDEAAAVLRSPAATSGFIGARYREILPEGSAAGAELGRRINFLDPPDHTRVRHHVGRAWTPKRVGGLRGWVEQLAERLLDDVAPEGGDLRPVAHALPSLVISELLGVPDADRALLAELTETTAPLLGLAVAADDMARGLEASERFAAYVESLLDDRRRAGGEDLLTALLAEPLSHDELVSLVVTLYAAGHRTTRDLFSWGLVALLRSGGGADDARRTTEEMVRHSTPTHYVARVLTEEVAGIPPWEPVLLFLAAANRDPRHWPDPERFDAGRDPAAAPAPLSFALGPHHCLGANLARMEVEVLLRAVQRRWPRLELDGEPGWWCAGPFRGVHALPVRAC